MQIGNLNCPEIMLDMMHSVMHVRINCNDGGGGIEQKAVPICHPLSISINIISFLLQAKHLCNYETLTQCRFNIGSASATLVQH